jgi:hypothetical protein
VEGEPDRLGAIEGLTVRLRTSRRYNPHKLS